MCSILGMPELVIANIIGFLDFRAVFTIRQVCRDFRNFINEMDKSKLPDSKFEKIHVLVKNEEMIRMTFIWNHVSQIKIEESFEKEKPGFFNLISQRMFLKYFGNNNKHSNQKDLEMDEVLEVYQFVLKFQKSILQFYNDSPDFELSYVVVEYFEETRSLSSGSKKFIHTFIR
ncbi:Protein CBG17070 [Caenorhabditis briggsae]|uniref:Protein CBG17070 n=1 Tax=Caenorhabditis briggsae TaxID=6238 RepID=A8XQG1_CAEBR|nr:Protein CBG17070 [Caenorhabditis briggsae]CAP34886.2 Protein CBG17070 [Caenorhabditis briggsae]